GDELDPLERRRDDRDVVPRPLEDPHALAGALAIDLAAPRAHEVLARLGADPAPALELLGILEGLAAAPAVLVSLDAELVRRSRVAEDRARLMIAGRGVGAGGAGGAVVRISDDVEVECCHRGAVVQRACPHNRRARRALAASGW